MGTAASIQGEKGPPWMYTVVFRPAFLNDKISKMSDGFQSINGNTIVRSRAGKAETDGARWCRGFTSGKHIFEIVFPKHMRGPCASVGIATVKAPMYAKGRVTLVGGNDESWGINMATGKAWHSNVVVKRFQKLPDRFYMYIDTECQTLQFGCDSAYYGTAHDQIDTQGKAVYPMVSAALPGATITMVYRGIGIAVEGPLRQNRRTRKKKPKSVRASWK